MARRPYEQKFHYELLRYQLEHSFFDDPQPQSTNWIEDLNETIREQVRLQRDAEADTLYSAYLATIRYSGIENYQSPIALFYPDRFFWYNDNKLHCFVSDIQLEKNKLCETFEFKYDDKTLYQLMWWYGIPNVYLTKVIFNALGHFQSKTRYSAYHTALQKLKWLTGTAYLPLCDSPYANFFFYKDCLFCYVNKMWRAFTTDILDEHIQRGTKVCFSQTVKREWLDALIKLPQMRRFSPQVFYEKIILDYDHQSCTLVKYSKDLDKFEYEFPNLWNSPPFGRTRQTIYSNKLSTLPIRPSNLLCKALFDICDGRISTLDSISELFARAMIEGEPSRYIWVLGGRLSYIDKFLKFAQKVIGGVPINGVRYDNLFTKDSLDRLLNFDLYGRWGLFEIRHSFVPGRKRKKLRAFINGETIGSIVDELRGEIKVSSQMLAIIGINSTETISSDLQDIPHKTIELKDFMLPELSPNSDDVIWLKTLFAYHGMRIIYGGSLEQRSGTGEPLKVFIEKFCTKDFSCWYDGKTFYNMYSRWLAAAYPGLTITGSTKFLNSISAILNVKYEPLRANKNRKALIGISVDKEKCESEIFDTALGTFSFEDFVEHLNSFERYKPINPFPPEPCMSKHIMTV